MARMQATNDANGGLDVRVIATHRRKPLRGGGAGPTPGKHHIYGTLADVRTLWSNSTSCAGPV